MSDAREQIRDELAGFQIGAGYYTTAVSVGEAGEMADALLARWPGIAAVIAGPTDAMVEDGARALWARQWSTTWDSYSVGRVPASDRVNDLRAHEMRAARTALMAALGIDAEGETDEA